ncbi:Acetylglucosaminyltransferase, partial [Globisporangium splendens]
MSEGEITRKSQGHNSEVHRSVQKSDDEGEVPPMETYDQDSSCGVISVMVEGTIRDSLKHGTHACAWTLGTLVLSKDEVIVLDSTHAVKRQVLEWVDSFQFTIGWIQFIQEGCGRRTFCFASFEIRTVIWRRLDFFLPIVIWLDKTNTKPGSSSALALILRNFHSFFLCSSLGALGLFRTDDRICTKRRTLAASRSQILVDQCTFRSSFHAVIYTPEDELKLALQTLGLYNDAIAAIANNTPHAIQLLQQSIDTYPLAPAYNNLGWLLLKSDAHGHGEHAAMVALECGAVVATETKDTATYADIQTNLGHVVRTPLHVTALYNKASALFAIREYQEAESLIHRALELEPNHVFAHLDLGLIYYARGDLELALKHHDLAIANANSASQRLKVMTNKANFLLKEGFAAEALAIFEEMHTLKPNGALEVAHVVMTKRVLCLWNGVEDLHDRLVQSIEHELQTTAVGTGSSLYPFDSTLLRVSGAFRKRVAVATAGRNEQPVTLELFPATAIPTAKTMDPSGARAMSACKVFRGIADVSDLEASQQIALDRVDIVIDLMVYTTGTRSGITALKLSPIIVNYLGYPDTSGASSADYVIADRFVVPPERAQASMSEQLVYLPHTYQANLYELENNEPCLDAAMYDGAGDDEDDKRRRFVLPTCPLARRSDCGLPDAAIVFCNFNTINKYEPVAFFTWMRILHRVPGSVVWLLEPSSYDGETIMDTLYRGALARGIHPSRIMFAAREDKSRYMARLTLADVFLDSFVYNAHSTASDALWARVPIVTFWGDAFPSRVAGSLAHNPIPFPEIVPHSVKEYEDLAVTLAHNPALVRRIRHELASQTLASPLFDSRRTTLNLETSYEVTHDLTHRMLPQCRKGKRFHALVNPEASQDFAVEANTELRLQRALQRGIVHHQDGRMGQAQYYYLMVLQVNPKHADALHLLGASCSDMSEMWCTRLGKLLHAVAKSCDEERCRSFSVLHLLPR